MAAKSTLGKTVPASSASQDTSDIRFDPRRFMAAMLFHACEGGDVCEVSASSVSLTMRRLVRQRSCAVMARQRWASLSNAQRFQWLLKVTRTDF